MIVFLNKRKAFKVTASILLAISIGFVLGCQEKKHLTETTLPRGSYDVVKMANGAVVTSQVISTEGANNALETATTPQSYNLQLSLNVTLPSSAFTLKDLSAATPEITQALPSLEEMLPSPLPDGKKYTSPFYSTLFNNKVKALQYQLSHLGQLFPRESLYDCQTILPLINKKNGARALLIQAIMNVNADGSDGDRNIPLEKLSSYYQPQTNYRWPKSSLHLNPNLPTIEELLTHIKESMTNTTLPIEQQKKLQDQLTHQEQMRQELQHWSFLIGSADPFIVLPKFMLDSKNQESAGIGDYAVVLYHGTLYPAIVGDIGPASKIGEASLRLCRTIDPRSGADHRPESEPHVSYFVFPKSAELPMKAPDYAHWSERCHQLWSDLGGSSALTWHEWTSLEQPWPEEKKNDPLP